MANTGRYFYTPAAGKIRGNKRTLKDRFRRWLKMRTAEVPDVYQATGYGPMIYPEGYKK